MRSGGTLAVAVSLAFAGLAAAPAAASPQAGSPQAAVAVIEGLPGTTDRFVVGFHEMPPGVAPGGVWRGARIESVNHSIRFIAVEAPEPEGFLGRAAADPAVRYIEEDPIRQLIDPSPAPLLDPPVRAVPPLGAGAGSLAGGTAASFTPNDPRWSQQYGPRQIRADLAWETTLGSTAAAVCVIDTGVRRSHEDIGTARWLGWANFVTSGTTPFDDNGHGTHVAGIAAATINNGLGIAGVANAGIYGVKVLNSQGSGTWSGVANGITWCADNTIERTVLNLSLGGSSGAQVLLDAVRHAEARGKLVIAAAGNSGPCSNCILFPARYAEAVAVTCTTSNESLCGFSSTGPQAELAAPGASILSTWHSSDTAYHTISGTSMSAPHVAGAAALAWGHHTGLSASQLRQRARDTAKDLGSSGWNASFGYGRVDALCLLVGAAFPCPVEPDPPSAPRNLAAAPGPGSGEITLAWDAPLEGTVATYRVYRRPPTGSFSPIAEVPVATRSYRDTGLGEGATFVYAVAGVNTAGEGPLSGEATARTFARPSPPRNLTATAGPGRGEITLRWQPPADDGGTPLSAYRIERRAAAGSWGPLADAGVGTLEYRDSGLGDDVTFAYRVRAVNLVGAGPPSNEETATTISPPSAPRNLAAVAGPDPGAITLAWDPPDGDGGSLLTGYRVYRQAPAGEEQVGEVAGSVHGFTDAGLGDGVTHTYRVRAVNMLGEGPPSNPASATTLRVPGEPLALAAEGGPGIGDITLGWDPPADDGGGIASYRIYRRPAGGGEEILVGSVAAGTTSFRDRQLPRGAAYTYRVRAANSVGEGPPSAEATAATFDYPAAPADLAATPGPGLGEITLSWEPPADQGGTEVVTYWIYRGEDPGWLTPVAAVSGDQHTWTDTGRTPFRPTYYQVAASNVVGLGPRSATACGMAFPWVTLPGGPGCLPAA